MAKVETFKVSKAGEPAIEASLSLPENLDDPRWSELVEGDVREAQHTLALQNFIIKLQGAARGSFSDGAAAVQTAVEAYRYGGRRAPGTGRKAKRVTMDTKAVKKLKFTPEQIEALKAAGMSFDEASE